MRYDLRSVHTFYKNNKVLLNAINSGKIDPKHFKASDLGLTGSSCKCLINWGMIKVVSQETVFVDKDGGMYHRLATNVYKVVATKKTIENYNRQIEELEQQIKKVEQLRPAAFIDTLVD